VSQTKNFDVIIIGAGPAGLFATYELQKKHHLKILLIDKGKSAFTRQSSDVLWGCGGGGLFSDGKLNFTPRIGKTDISEFIPLKDAEKLIEDLEKDFAIFGMDAQVLPSDLKKAQDYRSQARKSGLDLQIIRQKHLGSDKLPLYIQNMEKYLSEHGISFLFETEVENILSDGKKVTGISTSSQKYFAPFVIAAPGRSGNHWFTQQLSALKITSFQQSIEIGVRVETSTDVLHDLCSVIYDPTFYFHSLSYDDKLRTFCTNRNGYVTEEKYKEFVCVNGHSYSSQLSDNANFALLDKVSLTEPVTDTIAYGESICKLSSTIGAGRPILQRFVDFKKHHRSTWDRLQKSYVVPTLKTVTPGDISMALPHRIVVNLIEGIEILDKMLPGLASDATLLYAPEVKFFSVRPTVTSTLETELKGLFVAGDGAGVSGNIVGAAATGVIAAQGIISKN